MLPEINEALDRIESLRKRLGIHAKDIKPLVEKSGGNGGGRKSAEYLSDILEMNSVISRLTEKGVLIKDLSLGLIDFPHIREGKEVLLCWKRGEDTIRYWHEVDAGYVARKEV